MGLVCHMVTRLKEVRFIGTQMTGHEKIYGIFGLQVLTVLAVIIGSTLLHGTQNKNYASSSLCMSWT
jgi:hypothetical protein